MALKILLADDSMVAQSMGKKILADAGYDVAVASNGAAALKQLTEVQPDIILLDVYMPGYTGLEVCQKVKSAPETARTPVLLTVGMLEPFRPEDGIRARADGVIVKPFEATDLVALVAKIAERIPAERRRAAGATVALPSAAVPAAANGAAAPVHAKGQEFPRQGEAVSEEALSSFPTSALPPVPPAAEVAAVPAVLLEDSVPGAGAEAAGTAPAKEESGREEEAEQQGSVLQGAEAAAALTAALAAAELASASWQKILSGNAQPASGGEAEQTAVPSEPSLEPTLRAAIRNEGGTEPDLMSDLQSADWLRGALANSEEAARLTLEGTSSGFPGPDALAHEAVMKTAMYDSGVEAKQEFPRFPPIEAEADTASLLPELLPTSTALEAGEAAEVAAPPGLETAGSLVPEATAAPEMSTAVTTEIEEAPQAPVAALPGLEIAGSLMPEATAAPEMSTAVATEIEEAPEVPVAAGGAEAAAEAEPQPAAEAGARADSAVPTLAEQIVDLVLERVRPELVKEVARLLN